MPTTVDIRRANEIIRRIKDADGKIELFEVLDQVKIPLFWWRTHKKWFFGKFKYVTTEEIDDLLHLVMDVEEKTTISEENES